jgi:hypothetical protein
VIERHRQAVSPEGDITEERAALALDSVNAEVLEAEATEHAFRARPRRTVAATREYVGSEIVVLEAA